MFSMMNILCELRTCHEGSYCRIAVPACCSMVVLFPREMLDLLLLCLALQKKTLYRLGQGLLDQEVG